MKVLKRGRLSLAPKQGPRFSLCLTGESFSDTERKLRRKEVSWFFWAAKPIWGKP